VYKNLVIYYFSGTGNAKAVANWIIETFHEKEVPTQIIEIKKGLEPDVSSINTDTLVGFCYPTHGFNAPPIVLDFIARFPKTVNAKFFVLNTQAGMKLYKIFMPGLSGIALFLPALILQIKGYRCANIRPMDMPSNWISLHPGLRAKVTKSIIDRCERISHRFANKLIDGKRDYRWLAFFPLDILVAPIAIPYYLIGRFMIAKTFFASSKCNSCGLCAKQCAVEAIEMVNNRPYWKFSCESCMHCMNTCKRGAIETAHGFSFLVWWVAFFILPMLAINLLIDNEILSLEVSKYINTINTVLQILFGFTIVFFGYRILHFLLRFKFFNILITYTSLTKLPFWRRYKYKA
jgi:NAD-dependent dihydropyrimidine dehydrogenase PreA subunit